MNDDIKDEELGKLYDEYSELRLQGQKLVEVYPNTINEDSVEGLELFISSTEMMVSIAKNMLAVKRKIIACQTK